MRPARLPKNEKARLQALADYNILDTDQEGPFNRITRIVAATIGVPIALVSLVDEARQWFKSHHGLDATETPRDVAFCAHAILGDDVFVVENALEDDRFSDNPLVTEVPNVVFYAGAPLITPDNFRVGTLCAIDHKPHRISDDHRLLLQDLASLVVDEMELRKALKHAKTDAVEQRRLRDVAETTERSKSQFLATMSHEIRTPMNGILGMVGNLMRSELAPQQREQVEVIKESGDALLDILNDILDLSKIEAGHLELEYVDFHPKDLLETMAALWVSRARVKGLDFNLKDNLSDTDVVRADGSRLRQVLYNLISNSLKFTEDGSITVTVRRRSLDDRKVRLRFEVRDTGIGMDNEGIDKLFKPFSQADASTTRKYGGTGLGLSICKNIVELHGGEIGVESAVGEGSCFWFEIDAEKGDPANLNNDTTDSNEMAEKLTAIGKPLRILVAEDNQINQRVIEHMLVGALNCRPDFVANGHEVLQQVQAKKYDVVLMDVQMPEMDGPTATQKIRALKDTEVANIPIIALTANAMKGDRDLYLAAGMNDYVSKPIDEHALFGAIFRMTNNPEIKLDALPAVVCSQQQIRAEPLSAEQTAELDNMISEIDVLITDNDS
jgi:signal transduction histidine kinase/CheY-like chemotaxis protein